MEVIVDESKEVKDDTRTTNHDIVSSSGPNGNHAMLDLNVGSPIAGAAADHDSVQDRHTAAEDSITHDRVPQSDHRFKPNTCSNAPYCIAFLVSATGVAWLAASDLGRKVYTTREDHIMLWCCLVALVTGLGCLMTWIYMPRMLLWFSQFTTILLLCLLSFIYCFMDLGSRAAGIICGIAALALAYWLWKHRNNKEFAAVMIEMVAHIVADNPLLLVIVAIVVIVQTVWLMVFSLTCIEAVNFNHYGSLYIYLFLAYFWTTQVMKHIVSSTVAGTIGHWYFRLVPAHMRAAQISEAHAAAQGLHADGSPHHARNGSNGDTDATDASSGSMDGGTTIGPHGETIRLSTVTFNSSSMRTDDHISGSIPLLCAKLSITYCLGPICYGSLLIAPALLLWRIFRRFSNRPADVNDRCMTGWAVCERFAMRIESLYHSFNKFAFPAMIMYGKDFRQASRDTWDHFFARGVDAIIDADHVDSLLLFPSIGAGCITASLCCIWARYDGLDDWFLMSVAMFWVGFSTVALTTQLVEAAVSAIFACFAEDPRFLAETHPIIFHRFVRISEFSAFRDKSPFSIS